MKSFVKYVWEQFRKPMWLGGDFSTLIMNQMNKKQYQSVLDTINIQLTDTILDIGFWNWYLIKKLLKYQPKKISWIDISQDMVNKVSRRYQKEIESFQLDISLSDVKNLPYEDGSFDKIYTVNTLYFWDDPESAFSEIVRVLKNWGFFLNVIYSKEWLDSLSYTKYWFSKYSLEDIQIFTETSGLSIKEIILISNKAFCIVAMKV